MIPFRDLITKPNDYAPLGTETGYRNRLNADDFTNVDIKAVFRSDSNVVLLTRSLFRMSRVNGETMSVEQVRKMLPKIMNAFCAKTDIYAYSMAEDNVFGYKNWVGILRAINNDFLKYAENYFRPNLFNPNRAWVEVGDSEHRKQVKMKDVLAHDIPTIDVWAEQEVSITNGAYRDHNKIPFYQRSMHNRHYDRNNDGLQHAEPERASLDTPVYGYDMQPIYSLLDRWTDQNWFGN